jgi:hypothetical protein
MIRADLLPTNSADHNSSSRAREENEDQESQHSSDKIIATVRQMEEGLMSRRIRGEAQKPVNNHLHAPVANWHNTVTKASAALRETEGEVVEIKRVCLGTKTLP